MTDNVRHLPMPDTNAWPAFTLAWDDNLPGPTDVSYLLDKPAGARGFIKAVDSHLATGDGQRWRIWGQHLVRSQALPPMHLAPVIARQLAKFGLNCMRLHAIDYHWPDGIIPLLAAYARLQDWDGVIFYDYHPWPGPYWREEAWAETYQHYWFDVGDNPVKMAQTALGALMFLRGDAQAARETVMRSIPRKWALETVRYSDRAGQGGLRPYWLPYLPGRLALVHRTCIADPSVNSEPVPSLCSGQALNAMKEQALDAAQPVPAEGEVALPQGRIVSDTGELIWEDTPGDGRVLIDTPRQQAIIGRAGARATSNLALDLQTPFAAVQLASLDERPIAQAERLLLVIGARVANTDQKWADDARQSLAEWGHAPTRIEPVTGRLTFHALADAGRVTVQPLDSHGQPAGETMSVAAAANGFAINLGSLAPSPWYLMQVSREG
jgi:hypothetical protein